MLNAIIKFSLNNKLAIMLSVLLITIGGIYTMQKIEVDVFPDLTSPTVVVLTDATGMAPEEVERLVTFPIETAVNGATNVRRVRSTSSQGFSFVWVEFDWGVDIYKARQVVSEKLVTLADALPQGISPKGTAVFIPLSTSENVPSPPTATNPVQSGRFDSSRASSIACP